MAEAISESATSREKLLEAAEALMLESGYASVTSRRLAAKAGLKPQLVHYHFKSMDDLFLEVYRRFATRLTEQQEAVLQSDKPLTEMWKVTTAARGALLTEFLALANHRKAIRKEITEFGYRFRQSQIDTMKRILARKDIQVFPWSPAFAALLLNSLARGLAMEEEFGMTEGHAEMLAVVERYLMQLDG